MSRPFTAEIIGPAGSGKSTLTTLLSRDAAIKTGLSVWRLPLPLLIRSAFSSVRELVIAISVRRFSWEDLKLIIQINALRRLLSTESTKGYRALLCDEGNVFGLAKLNAFGAQSDSNGLSRLVNHVAPTLDAVIWLDAPDAVLVHRIRTREKSHRTKFLSEAEISEHLARYRAAFEKVVAQISERNRIKIIRFSTDSQSLEDIAGQILAGAQN